MLLLNILTRVVTMLNIVLIFIYRNGYKRMVSNLSWKIVIFDNMFLTYKNV